MSEPYVPEPPETRLEWATRELPLCPECKGLARRDILALTSEGQQYGPWRCDIHGELDRVEYETLEVPSRYVEDAARKPGRSSECGHDGWTAGCPVCAREERHARAAMGEEGGYELSDPKHPRHHEVYADLADMAD